MLRRAPFSLPYPDQVPLLASVLGPGAPAEPPDPPRLVEAALYHRVTGHVARGVERGELRLGERERGRLARIGAVHRLHSHALRRELAEIEPAVAAACDAPPVCIKGPVVADRLYEDPALRTFADLDLLVPRRSLEAAAASLEARGYEPVHEFRPGFGSSHGHDFHLRRRVGRRSLDVELHWRVGDDPACSVLDHALLSGGPRLDVEGREVAAPAPAEQLLCLAVHLVSDRSKRLAWVDDVARAGAGLDEAEWARAFELSRELGLGWALHRGLDYALHHLHFERGRPLPPGPAPAWGPLRAVEELDARASLHVGRLATLGWRARLRYLRDVLVPTPEGLTGTVGRDPAPTSRLVARHLRAIALGLLPSRR